MDIIRNFINVIGITPEDELPDNPNGQIIQYSDTETINIPGNKPGAKSIFQIMIQVEIKSKRIINAPLMKTMAVDGIKRYKIIYTEESDNANFLVVETPYNTFIELPREYDSVGTIEVYIMDAYFSLLDSRRIYSYILYLVHADYSQGSDNEKGAPPFNAVSDDDSNVKKGMPGLSKTHDGIMGEVLVSMEPGIETSSFYKPEYSIPNNAINDNMIDIDAEYL